MPENESGTDHYAISATADYGLRMREPERAMEKLVPQRKWLTHITNLNRPGRNERGDKDSRSAASALLRLDLTPIHTGFILGTLSGTQSVELLASKDRVTGLSV